MKCRELRYNRTYKERGKRLLYLVEVHQLHLVVGDLLLVGALEHEGDGVSLVLSLDSDDVVVGSTPRMQDKIGPRKLCYLH